MSRITVIKKQTTGDRWEFHVTVQDEQDSSEYSVFMNQAMLDKYTDNPVDPAVLVQQSFEFLLARESKESILSSFSLDVIERYFPEYPNEMKKLCSSD